MRSLPERKFFGNVSCAQKKFLLPGTITGDDWIRADDNNFITNDTRLDSIVETTATDYSVGNLYSASTGLTPKNLFVAFTGKK